ncbi:DUF3298 and DUF4163 domain-containing protein [uncultured Psychroserpens sp.]|uniref:DUF3298 and DUF4163 domain-containing protein n=1 Tax=uncultured Psychroserpens sp. TaxID=255436 RepID=UPI0026163A43|nr:DUF3298 and DUF4163 domain-containing protein [uncultured Psychroserpens sp.]
MKKTALFLYILTLVCSCTKEAKLNFTEQHIETSEVAEISIVYPKAEGSKNLIDNINSPIEDYIVNQINFSEDAQTKLSIDDAVAKFNYEFKNFKNDFPDSAQQWEALIGGEVTYQSPEIITIAINSYLDTGGAHGNTNVRFFNFDPQTGRLLTKKDLISNLSAFSKEVKRRLAEEMKTEDNPDFEDLFFGKDFELPESLGYSDEGLIILYNPYEIASYAQGIIEFTIPFETIDSYLKLN